MMNQAIQGGAYGPTQSREVLQSNFQDFQGSHPKTQVKNERNVPQNKFILEQISNDPHFVQRQADMKLVMRNPLFHEFHYNKLVEPQYVAPQHKESFNKDHEKEAADSLDIFKNNYEARQVNLDRAKVGSNLMNYDLGSQSQQTNIPVLQGQQQQYPQQQRVPSMQMRQDQNQYQPQEQRRTGNSRHLRASSSLVSLTNNSILNQNNNPQPQQYEQYPQTYQPNSYPEIIPNQQQQTYLPQQVLNYEDLQQQPDQQLQQQQLLQQQQVRSPQTQQYQQFQSRTPSQALQQSQLRTPSQQLQSKMRSPLLLQANNMNNNSNIFQARPAAIPNSRGNNNNVPNTQYDSLEYQQQLLQQESQLLKQQQMQLEQQQQLLQQQSYQQQQAQNPGGQIAALGIQGSAAPQQYPQSLQTPQQQQQLGQQYLEDQGIDQQFVSQGQQQQQQPLRNSQKLPSRYATPSILSDKHLKKIYNPLNQKVQAIYEPRYDIKVNWDMLERDQFRNFQGRTEPFNEIIRQKNNALELHPDYSTVNQEYGLKRLR